MEPTKMEHRYTPACGRPDYDEQITRWLDSYEARTWNGVVYNIALYHDGYIYRSLCPNGHAELVAVSKFLHGLGLIDILNELETFRGFSSVFAIPEVKRLRAKGEFVLSEIPQNHGNLKNGNEALTSR